MCWIAYTSLFLEVVYRSGLSKFCHGEGHMLRCVARVFPLEMGLEDRVDLFGFCGDLFCVRVSNGG